jgi:cytidylate kinase
LRQQDVSNLFFGLYKVIKLNASSPLLSPVITIDGPTASGKGTVAHRVATALGWGVLDSGALYRLTALSVLQQAIDPEDSHAVARAGHEKGLQMSQYYQILRRLKT